MFWLRNKNKIPVCTIMHYYLEVILAIVLVQPRKNRPYITERLLLGRKESNKQTNKNYLEACQMHAMYVFV